MHCIMAAHMDHVLCVDAGQYITAQADGTTGWVSASCSVAKHALFSQCATTSSSHFWWSVTGSHDSVASLTPLALNSLYLRARRPISVVHTGCAGQAQARQTVLLQAAQVASAC